MLTHSKTNKIYQEEIAKLKSANNALHQQIQYFKEKHEEIENKSHEAKFQMQN